MTWNQILRIQADGGRHLPCREVSGKKNLKDEILKTCDKRNDLQSEEIRVRLSGAVADLHAADARYHVDCKAKFMSPLHVKNSISNHIRVIKRIC